jgi:hypothetical protein
MQHRELATQQLDSMNFAAAMHQILHATRQSAVLCCPVRLCLSRDNDRNDSDGQNQALLTHLAYILWLKVPVCPREQRVKGCSACGVAGLSAPTLSGLCQLLQAAGGWPAGNCRCPLERICAIPLLTESATQNINIHISTSSQGSDGVH